MTSPVRILITGAGSGLGRAIALAWARRGARVLIADIAQVRSEETVALCMAAGATEASFLPLDIRQEADFQNARSWLEQHWHGVDIVVNNAGVAGGGNFDGISEDDWQWMLDINLMGVVRGCRAFTPLFQSQQQGQFVNIASMAGLLNPPAMANYNVAKAGVIALSETLAAELMPWNIHTLVVCPSYFQTNLNESLRTNDPLTRMALDKLLASSAITADDIAEGILAAVDNGEQLYLPHEQARMAWDSKRNTPGTIPADMQAYARKLAAVRGQK